LINRVVTVSVHCEVFRLMKMVHFEEADTPCMMVGAIVWRKE
tara:strand:- start:2921 stop:3046 length:126 start_codon:yes stop_codon:yes gene_type:complete